MASVTAVPPVAPATDAPPTTPPMLNPRSIQDHFLKLLVAQIKHQDPLNPIENSEFTTQLSQFSMVESLQNIQKGVDRMAAAGGAASLGQSTGLLGHSVRTTSGITGVVTGLGLEQGTPVVMLGDQTVPLADIVEIRH